MKLWIDDERVPPDASWYHAHTVVEGLEMILRQLGTLEAISLDHDFGLGQPTGYDLVYCLGRLKGGITQLPYIEVHSQNPDGRTAMLMLLERLEINQ